MFSATDPFFKGVQGLPSGRRASAYPTDADIIALDLWAGGAAGMWYDPSDLTTLFQSADTSVPVTASGQPVRRCDDKSGNGNNWIAAGDAARPIYNSSSGLSWLKYDGSDDQLETTAALTTGMSVYISINRLSDAQYITAWGDATNEYFGALSAVAGGTNATAGTPTYRVNGLLIPATRAALLAAVVENAPVVMTVEALNINNWSTFKVGAYPSWEFGGRLFGCIVCPDQSPGNRTIIEQYMAGRGGFAL